MRPTVYVSSSAEFDKHKRTLKLTACPHCRAVGFLIRHGYLSGHGEGVNDEVQRGWRIFCSNRRRRKGCGKTYAVLLTTFLFCRMVGTEKLWLLLRGIRQGLSIKAAWEKVASPFCLETGYRLWKAFLRSQTSIRSLLLRADALPRMNVADLPVRGRTQTGPAFQVIEHLRAVFRLSPCPVAEFQCRFQAAFLAAPRVNRSG